MKNIKCQFCGGEVEYSSENFEKFYFDCPICGKYQITLKADHFSNNLKEKYDIDKVASYLYYNKNDEYIPVFMLENAPDDENYLSPEIINSWYPQTFSEKIDRMLLALEKKTDYMGEELWIPQNEFLSLAFLKRIFNKKGDTFYSARDQIDFLSKYTYDNNLVYITNGDDVYFCIKPEGWKRIDELQRHTTSNSKTVFVAMSFAEDMKSVEDAIRNSILSCGFKPMIIKDKEYNRQIVPEILHEIKQARFVIAEFTNHNNGAYYEAGYALALGKEVIHLCKDESFDNDAHFDVKQVNTIRWKTIDDLEEKLIKRIKATIS